MYTQFGLAELRPVFQKVTRRVPVRLSTTKAHPSIGATLPAIFFFSMEVVSIHSPLQ